MIILNEDELLKNLMKQIEPNEIQKDKIFNKIIALSGKKKKVYNCQKILCAMSIVSVCIILILFYKMTYTNNIALHAKGMEISIYSEDFQNEFISLTDIARYKSDEPNDVIKNWMRNRDTIEF